MVKNLLKVLINCSEKAANIARICRKDLNLLALLTEEKTGDQANPRFVKDFKTLADVLIQETIRNDVGRLFPELRENIKGEESPHFTNSLGDSITVCIGDTTEKTMACLARVLNGNKLAADVLSYEVHKQIISDVSKEAPELPDIDLNEIGIWIDPIDATSEYIAGDTFFTSFPGITSTGLDCVTVLIGVYNKKTGIPIIGIINQPFHRKIDTNSYEGKIYWGVSIDDRISLNNIDSESPKKPNKVAVLSSSEHQQIKELIQTLNYEIAFAAGAGHKALKVITNEANLYLLSKGTTYKWDTCAPHAILNSLGGGMFDFRKCIKQAESVPLSYLDDTEKCNSGGIIALRDMSLFSDLLKVLTE